MLSGLSERKAVVKTFKVYFDGGTNGSNLKRQTGYGSWEIIFNGFSKREERIQFEMMGEQRITNNVAEYLSLRAALEWLKSVQLKHGYEVVVSGDSQLVLFTLTGRYKTKAAHLIPLRDSCRQLLNEFGAWDCEWNPRKNSVARFGH